MLFEMGFIPNIRQRRDAVNRGKPSRSKAARMRGARASSGQRRPDDPP